jgi:hypothetical protein
MMPSDERGDLWLQASWSPLLPSPEVPARVQIDRDLYRSFEELASQLRPPSEPKQDLFVGRVSALQAYDNDEGRLEGEMVLQLQVEDEIVRAYCPLDADTYGVALHAHGHQLYLSLRGVLHRAAKRARIEGAQDIRVVQ